MAAAAAAGLGAAGAASNAAAGGAAAAAAEALDAVEAAAAAEAWRVLPVKAFALRGGEVPDNFVPHMSGLLGLTRLEVRKNQSEMQLGWQQLGRQARSRCCATAGQLADVLRQLTSLRCLELFGVGLQDGTEQNVAGDAGDGGGGLATRAAVAAWHAAAGFHDVEGVAALQQAIAGLSTLEEVQVDLPVQMEYSARQQLSDMLRQQQLLLPAGRPRWAVQPEKIRVFL
jgi:hypothetical protein